METILAELTAGVVAVGPDGRVTTVNQAAERLFVIDRATVIGRDYMAVFARSDLAPAREMIAELRAGVSLAAAGGRVERQMKLLAGGRMLTLVLTATMLRDAAGQALGALLFCEDVTEIVKVQRMEAWREVARRIAHEIKNPLTPIQLSAQRLHKRYAEQLKEDGTLFEECTRTIVRQVEELKTLVNEFATFARLPAGEHTPEDLNALVEEAMVLFREGHRQIAFAFDPDPSLPRLPLDREGIKRAVINMLDNAVAACDAATNGTHAAHRRPDPLSPRARLRRARGRRHRDRHQARGARPALRAVLFHQAGRDRTRSRHRVDHRGGSSRLRTSEGQRAAGQPFRRRVAGERDARADRPALARRTGGGFSWIKRFSSSMTRPEFGAASAGCWPTRAIACSRPRTGGGPCN